MEEGKRKKHPIKDFCKRHWLGLTITGVVVAAGIVYIVCNGKIKIPIDRLKLRSKGTQIDKLKSIPVNSITMKEMTQVEMVVPVVEEAVPVLEEVISEGTRSYHWLEDSHFVSGHTRQMADGRNIPVRSYIKPTGLKNNTAA